MKKLLFLSLLFINTVIIGEEACAQQVEEAVWINSDTEVELPQATELAVRIDCDAESMARKAAEKNRATDSIWKHSNADSDLLDRVSMDQGGD